MSAYICNRDTISVLALAFDKYDVEYRADGYEGPKGFMIDVRKLRNNIGQSLLDQNFASVNYRYKEDIPAYDFECMDIQINEGLVYECIGEYEYQACETPGYYESALHFSLIRLQKKLLERLIHRCGMKTSGNEMKNVG